ncbi:DUF4168 domain-containing protein [Oscillatoriales cyanobacterium LEGE 11467]|uniref:DUF4168 domain-containing protein n=1 Tax=Zarconia navalis LEGE 11467 TaxID=1828826 RepID=A0A928VY10_9CYAN|nr:DUF4168 domain-containing protein [Zarconia navalis]MBE9042379.1 DUF4168 domain-containing protein [Zarconia navalis LEGE 11467]
MGQYSRHVWTKTIVAIALGSTLLASCAAGNAPGETEVGEEPVLDKEQTIAAYARSVWEIDRLRRTAYQQIDEANDDNPPPQVICDNPETVAGLRGQVKQIAVDYCLQAQDIVREQRLSVPIFNEVTQRLTQDAQLKAEVENELRRIQQSSGS